MINQIDWLAIGHNVSIAYLHLFGITFFYLLGKHADFKSGSPQWLRYAKAILVLLIVATIYGASYDGTICIDADPGPYGHCEFYETIDENVTAAKKTEKGLGFLLLSTPAVFFGIHKRIVREPWYNHL